MTQFTQNKMQPAQPQRQEIPPDEPKLSMSEILKAIREVKPEDETE